MGTTSATIFLALFVAVLASQCNVYKCVDNMADGRCAISKHNKDYDNYDLRVCKGEMKICDYHGNFTTSDICSDHYTTGKMNPGEYCRNDAECVRGGCKNHHCGGKPANQTCADDFDCDAGLYCKNKMCVGTLAKDGNCTTDKCDAALVCNNKTCVEIGSLEDGQPATNVDACKSLYIGANKTCAPGLKLRYNSTAEIDPKYGPLTCTGSRTNCEYYNDKGDHATGPCLCGRTDGNLSFCRPGVGDIEYMPSYAAYAKALSTNGAVRCHVGGAKGPLCLYNSIDQMPSEFHKALMVQYRRLHWELYANNSECVKAILDPEYWFSAKKAEETENGAGFAIFLAITALSILVVAALLVYKRCQKPPVVSDPDGPTDPTNPANAEVGLIN